MNRFGLPFALPERAPVTRIRHVDQAAASGQGGERAQSMRGFDPRYRDIVDYIVGITDEIWTERSVGRIYDTYDEACTVYTSNGTVRSVHDVVASTLQSLHSQPDGVTSHLNVAWSGDEEDFYTSHLGFARSTNIGPTAYGPGTGKRYGIHFVADCVSRENKIHTEWLARDNLSLVRQLGLDAHVTAKRFAQAPPVQDARPGRSAPTDIPHRWDGPRDTLEGFWAHHFQQLWNRRELDHVAAHYAPGAILHWPGGDVARGHRGIQDAMLGLFASVPDARVSVEHISWSEETDGPIVAVRWQLDGTTSPLGALGSVPGGKPVSLIGMSHCRFQGRLIVEEWTMFDAFAALIQAYRA